MIDGMQVVRFRLEKDVAKKLLGCTYLPVLSPKDELTRKLLQRAHHAPNAPFSEMHNTTRAALKKLSQGMFGCIVTGATGYLSEIEASCAVCRQQIHLTYAAPLGNSNIKTQPYLQVFSEISVDPIRSFPIKFDEIN